MWYSIFSLEYLHTVHPISLSSKPTVLYSRTEVDIRLEPGLDSYVKLSFIGYSTEPIEGDENAVNCFQAEGGDRTAYIRRWGGIDQGRIK